MKNCRADCPSSRRKSANRKQAREQFPIYKKPNTKCTSLPLILESAYDIIAECAKCKCVVSKLYARASRKSWAAGDFVSFYLHTTLITLGCLNVEFIHSKLCARDEPPRAKKKKKPTSTRAFFACNVSRFICPDSVLSSYS